MTTPAGPHYSEEPFHTHQNSTISWQSDTEEDYSWDHRSQLLNKLLKQFGYENRVYPFALVGRKEIKQWGLCPGQREHAQHPGAFRVIPWQFWFYQLGRTRWRILTSYCPQTDIFPLKHCYLQDVSVPAYIASVGFTCPNLGTWKLDI